MTSTSKNDSVSIFNNGKLKPGIYRIQNIVGQTYVDIQDHAKELCGRPTKFLEGKGLWEVLPSGPGYTIRRVEPGVPDQFSTMLVGLGNESVVSLSTFPVAWRLEIVHDNLYHGCEYVRIFWGTTNMAWDLADHGSVNDRAKVQLKDNTDFNPCRIWKLIPGSGPPKQEAISAPSKVLPPHGGKHHCGCSHITTETK